MKIITRYVLREHIGPLLFSLTALTSLLMLQFVARQLGNLVGKGLPWRVIGEFFVLSLPFTVAMTLPMAVLVATLHAFGRMAAEHEVTAFKASGVRVTTLMWPVIVGAAFLAAGMVAFNDQVLPASNHRLRILQQDMSRTKPTLALNEQTLNQVTSGFYMRIGHLDRASNKMTDVTIYDLSEPFNRKTIYADSGDMAFTPDKKDLQLVLFDGFQQKLKEGHAETLERSYFRSQAVRVKDIGGGFEQTGNDDWKGDREKSICEMQGEYVVNAREYERVRQLYIEAARKSAAPGQKTMVVPKPRPATQGLARMYCNGLALVFRLPTAVPTVTPLEQPPAVANGSPAPVNGSVASGATPGSVQPGNNVAPGTAAPLSAAMQAQVDAAKAAMTIKPEIIDSGAIKAAAAEAAQVALENAAMAKLRDSAKTQAVVVGSKPDSTKPVSQPATPPTALVVPPAVAVAPPGTAVQSGAAQPPVVAPAVIPGVANGIPPSAGGQPQPGQAQPGQPQPAHPNSTAMPATAQNSAPSVPVGVPASSSANVDPMVGGMLSEGGQPALNAANLQLSLVRGAMDSLAVEIQKKFALSFACIVFVLFGPPIALRFPRGGVGATLGVSLVVFGLYYVCLMAGETLADNGKLPPVVAMWIANVIFTFAGILLLLRIEKTADASRSGGIRAWLEDRKSKKRLARRVPVTTPTAAT